MVISQERSITNTTRDVNSREIAFLGRESIVPGLDWDSRFRPSRYLLPAWSELDHRRGAKGEGQSLAGPWRHSRPMPGPHRSIDTAGGSAHGTSQNGWGMRERDWRSAMAISPGRRAGEWPSALPPTPADAAGQSVDVVGRWACKMAAVK